MTIAEYLIQHYWTMYCLFLLFFCVTQCHMKLRRICYWATRDLLRHYDVQMDEAVKANDPVAYLTACYAQYQIRRGYDPSPERDEFEKVWMKHLSRTVYLHQELGVLVKRSHVLLDRRNHETT